MSALHLDPVSRLTRDIVTASKVMSDDEARYLVDYYYIAQEDRKRSANQVRAMDESIEPNQVIRWLADQSSTLEGQIKRALDAYTEAHEMGSWMREIVGIGPVIAAGLLAHIDMEPWKCQNTGAKEKCRPGHACTPQCGRIRLETVGHIWRYAGLDPTQKWEKGQRRPWNAGLKTLCWKAGQSFMKFSGREDCRYGQLYRQRKDFEIARNERGENAQLAAQLKEKVGKTTEAFKHLSEGKLPPGQIDARARRWAVKIFLSHLHNEWYRRRFMADPPAPYPIAILGHAHRI